MTTYRVTVQFEGTKTYELDADSPEEIEALLHKHGSLDHIDNPVDDTVSERIVKVEESPLKKP